MHELDVGFKTPVWEGLRLDALDALPRIGTAVVLAAAALEVFIESTLKELAADSAIPADLWKWINKRESFLQEPGPSEQFDTLLKVLTGHSLKEDATLWQSFMNLKTARNKFVHEGVAKVGDQPIDEKRAGELVRSVGDVITWVRARLPADAQWKVFNIAVETQVSHQLLPDAFNGAADVAQPQRTDQ